MKCNIDWELARRKGMYKGVERSSENDVLSNKYPSPVKP